MIDELISVFDSCCCDKQKCNNITIVVEIYRIYRKRPFVDNDNVFRKIVVLKSVGNIERLKAKE